MPKQATAGSSHKMKLQTKPVAPYERVKQHVLAGIKNGEWADGGRLPSEHELVKRLGVSRMTIHRALRELSAEGLLSRIQGVGTFLLPPQTRSEAFKVQEIADEIIARGHVHRSKLATLEAVQASQDLAEAFNMRPGSKIFHSVFVHYEEGSPVQLEERYVNPAVAPEYLAQDFKQYSTGKYLLDLGHPLEIDHTVYAIAPDKRTQRLLGIDANEPCLLLVRGAWGPDAMPHSRSRFTYPGSRYSLGSHYKVSEVGERRVFVASSKR
jgi:GntR family histidine utilization transcriptional repressor